MSAVGPLRGESNDFFDFVIEILHRCEEQKCWKTLQATCAYACGYTASGAAILIDIFLDKLIYNIDDLRYFPSREIVLLYDIHRESISVRS